MTSGVYTPRPGSVAQRAIAHLESLPTGAELSSSALAEAAGVPLNGLVPCLQSAVEAGALERRQRGGHARSPIFWSLARPAPQAFDSPAVALATPCESKPAPPLTRTLVAPPSAIRIALWSDGELHIERDTGSGAADVVLLSADETRALVRYLDRMAVREGDLA